MISTHAPPRLGRGNTHSLGAPLIRPLPERFIAFFAGILVFTLIACGSDNDSTPASQPTASVQSTALAATPSPVPTATTAPVSTPTVVPPLPTVTATAVPPTPIPSVVPSTSSILPVAQDGLSGPEFVEKLGEAVMETLVVITNELSPRASTTEEERVAAEYLRSEYEAMGYDASIQPFDVRVLSRAVPLLTITSPMKLDIQAVPMSMTVAGEATAEFVDAGKALPADIPSEGLSGKIALIERGALTFQEKITNVTEAGAVAAVVYNNEPGLFAGALSDESSIPAMSISQEDGGAIKALIMDDEVVTANVTLIYTENSQNVIADKPGTANDGRVVVLGGHYDTVPNVSGANDNGSGTATILTIAREIANKEYPFTVRFIAFGSEELGLYGSKHYISQLSAEDTESTIAMLNFDALATGPVTGILGTIDLMRLIDSYAEENDIDVEMRFNLAAGTSSDHASFDQAGIPNVFFLGDDFSRIHTPEDRLEFVDPKLLGTSAALGIALLDILAEQD